jgi:hypothetical protein
LARDEHDQPTARGTCFDQLNAAHPMEMMIGLLGGGFAPVAIILSFLAEKIETCHLTRNCADTDLVSDRSAG